MTQTIDLHGLESQDALIVLQNHIFDLEEGIISDLTIITGKGSGILKTTFENFVKKHNHNSNLKLKYQALNDGSYSLWVQYTNDIYSNNSYESNWNISQNEVNQLFDDLKTKKLT